MKFAPLGRLLCLFLVIGNSVVLAATEAQQPNPLMGSHATEAVVPVASPMKIADASVCTDNTTIGICQMQDGKKLLRMNCAACCAQRTGAGWIPPTGNAVNCNN